MTTRRFVRKAPALRIDDDHPRRNVVESNGIVEGRTRAWHAFHIFHVDERRTRIRSLRQKLARRTWLAVRRKIRRCRRIHPAQFPARAEPAEGRHDATGRLHIQRSPLLHHDKPRHTISFPIKYESQNRHRRADQNAELLSRSRERADVARPAWQHWLVAARKAAAHDFLHLRQELHAELLQPGERHRALVREGFGHDAGVAAGARLEYLGCKKRLAVANSLNLLPCRIHSIEVAAGNQRIAADVRHLFKEHDARAVLRGCKCGGQACASAARHGDVAAQIPGCGRGTKELRGCQSEAEPDQVAPSHDSTSLRP